MTATVTPAELAEQFGSDGRTVRKFLRSITPKDEQPGKGSRWAIDGSKRSTTKLRKQFDEWHAAQLQERAARAAKAAEDAAAAVEEDDAEDLDSED